MRKLAAFILVRVLLLTIAAFIGSCGLIGFDMLPRVPGDGIDAGADDPTGGPSDAEVDAPHTGDGDGDSGEAGVQPDGALSSTCGNGSIEAGEECDDGAPSAACDADCSFASCGDGIVNTLAGEACDDGDRLASCSVHCRAPECRAGCTCEWYRGVRFMYCAEQLAYAPARQACEAVGMQLVRITSGTEQTYLRQRTQQDGFSKFHLGATDGASEGTWVWDDGTAFWQGLAAGAPIDGEFSAWAQGEPNAFTVDENCSEVQSIQGWNDCVCDLAKPFVCKEMRDARAACGNGVVEAGEACDGTGQTASCDADCSPAVCGDGVVNAAAGEQCDDGGSGQYCRSDCGALLCPAGCDCMDTAGTPVALCAGPQAFGAASVACGLAGMTLARVESVAVNQVLRAAAKTAGFDEYWIGIFDIDQPNRWLRSDLSPAWNGTANGTAVGYTNFAGGEPNGDTNKDCVAVVPDGKWKNQACSEQKAFICERL